MKGLLDYIDPANPSQEDYSKAEKFMVKLYGSSKETLDAARVTTLLVTDKPEENPPTTNSGQYHTKDPCANQRNGTMQMNNCIRSCLMLSQGGATR